MNIIRYEQNPKININTINLLHKFLLNQNKKRETIKQIKEIKKKGAIWFAENYLGVKLNLNQRTLLEMLESKGNLSLNLRRRYY